MTERRLYGTRDEFLARLAATPRDWFLVNAALRRPHANAKRDGCLWECPISAVLGSGPAFGSPAHYARAAGLLNAADANAVVDAADLFSTTYPELRQQLLRACGLAEDGKGEKEP